MKRAIFGAAVLTLAALSGCTTHESHRFQSRPHVPQTVSLVDTATGETVWTYEIPVGQELTVEFRRSNSIAEEEGWDEMSWRVGRIGLSRTDPPNTMRVPPASHRRLDLYVRAGTEAVGSLPTSRSTGDAMPGPTTIGSPAPAPAPAAAPATGTPKSAPKPPSGLALPDPKQAAPK